MIYVSAGGGYVGPEIVRRLARAGRRVRVLVSSADEAAALASPAVETVVGDRARPESFAGSLAGATVAMLFTRNARDLVAKDASFCRAAKAAGVRRVVKVSAFGASVDAEPGAKRVHGASEEAVKESGLAWTFLRPQFFQQNLFWFIPEIRAQGTFSLPMGEGRVGMIDYRDLADVAVRCLAGDGHEGRIYNLSGPELVSCNDIAAALTRVLGRPVRFNDMPPEAFRRLLISLGRPDWHAEEMTVSYVGMSKGASAVLSGDVERVLGRPATPFEAMARDYAHLFR